MSISSLFKVKIDTLLYTDIEASDLGYTQNHIHNNTSEKENGVVLKLYLSPLVHNLTYLRSKLNLSGGQVAEPIRVKEAVYYNYEYGKQHPDPDSLLKLSTLYNIELETLLSVILDDDVLESRGPKIGALLSNKGLLTSSLHKDGVECRK